VILIIFKEKVLIKKILIAPALIMLGINYYLVRQFYPALLPYQSESELAFYVKAQKLPIEDLVTFKKEQWSTDFYLENIIPEIHEEELSRFNLTGYFVFTTSEGMKIIEKYGYSIEPVKSFKDFPITTLNPDFINKNTREETLNETYLVYIQ
jgi:hypothetical protein